MKKLIHDPTVNFDIPYYISVIFRQQVFVLVNCGHRLAPNYKGSSMSSQSTSMEEKWSS
jgi:hypothetical protein